MFFVAPIVEGVVDSADAAVVALLDDRARPYCTGTLVAPDLVLTAAHCFEPPALAMPAGIAFGVDATSPDQVVGAARVRVHPDHDPESFAADVALVWLDRPVDVPPASLSDAAMPASWLGARVRIVGFGLTDPDEPGSSGVRRAIEVPIDEIEPARFRYGEATCGGDSGGPAFLSIGGLDVVAGVTSSGPPGCRSYGRSVRVDAVLAWIDEASAERAEAASLIRGGCSTLPGSSGRGASALALCLGLAALSLRRRPR